MNPLKNPTIKTDRLILNCVTEDDCSEEYAGWLNDPLVNQYLETRWTKQTIESILEFVRGMRNDPNSLLLAIRTQTDLNHIGNLKIGPINRNHGFADLSYFIGDRNAWGKGYGSEAVRAATSFAFESLGLRRMNAGVYSNNKASARVLEKCGFQLEGVEKDKFVSRNGFADHLYYGRRSPTQNE